MIALAIQVLWFLIGVLAICGVVYLVIYGINKFIYEIPPLVVQGIWFVVLLLVIIALLTLLSGGAGFRPPSFR